MGIVTAPIEGRFRRPTARSWGKRKALAEWLPQPLRDLFRRISLRYSYLKAEQDYRRVAFLARRMGEEWIHQEAMLVAQVEYYLKERGTS